LSQRASAKPDHRGGAASAVDRLGKDATAGGDSELPRRARRPSAAAVIARAAKDVPATKRISGPKLLTAEEPTKCSFATLDSNPERSSGDPPPLAIRVFGS
jgi:hypothetical protein